MSHGLLWTRHASAYVAAGSAFVISGAILDTLFLVAAGGGLLLAVAWDALVLQVRSPHVGVSVHPQRVPEGGNVAVDIEGRGLRPHHTVEVRLGVGLRLTGQTNVWQPRGQESGHSFTAEAWVRGPQAVGPMTVRHWSPARLWVRDHVLGAKTDVEVVPRVEDASRIALFSRVVKPMQGRFSVNRPGHGFDFFTLRQYASGDTMRDVNWKASARGEELIVNQRQLETHSEILVLLDARIVSGLGPPGQTPLDRGCRVALGILAEAMASRDTLRFAAYGDRVHQLHGRISLTELEDLMARLPAAGSTSMLDAWKAVRTDMKSNGPIIIVSSAEADDSLAHALADMAGRGHPITLFSPTPTDAMAGTLQTLRAKSREAALETARERGAVVVDWGVDAEVAAERPSREVVIA